MSNVLEPKDPDVAKTYSIDWAELLIGQQLRETDYVLGAVVRPNRENGFYLECTKAGRTGRYNPYLPRQANQLIADGSAEWTTKHPDDVTLTSVSSAVWTVPTGLIVDSQNESDAFTHVTLSGGVDGVDYDVHCRMTPSTGAVQEQTIIVPVRQQ